LIKINKTKNLVLSTSPIHITHKCGQYSRSFSEPKSLLYYYDLVYKKWTPSEGNITK